MLHYLNSEVWLYSALISSIQCFELNLAEELYLHLGTNPICADAILLTYVFVFKQ